MSRQQYSTNAIINDAPDGENGEENNKPKTVEENLYRNKNTLSQGMLDVALLTANASQLRYLTNVDKDDYGLYLYGITMSLVFTSIILQVTTAILLMIQSGFMVTIIIRNKDREILHRITVGLIFVSSFVDVIKSGIGFKPALQLGK